MTMQATAGMRRGSALGPATVVAVLAATVVSGLPAGAPPSAAQDPSGRPPAGPRVEIPYHNAAPRSTELVQRAVRAWREAGIRFVAVPRGQARVVIRPGPRSYGCRATTQIENPPRRYGRENVPVRYGYRRRAHIRLGEKCPSQAARAFATAHELGHALGLKHEDRRCSIMSRRGEVVNGSLRRSRRCSPMAWQALLRRLATDADLSTARALYRPGASPARDRGSDGSSLPALSPLGWAAMGMLGAVVVLGLAALMRLAASRRER